jgi:hypothetical protein
MVLHEHPEHTATHEPVLVIYKDVCVQVNAIPAMTILNNGSFKRQRPILVNVFTPRSAPMEQQRQPIGFIGKRSNYSCVDFAEQGGPELCLQSNKTIE